MDNFLSIKDFEKHLKSKLQPEVVDFYCGGADD
jgi:hypothetical protein